MAKNLNRCQKEDVFSVYMVNEHMQGWLASYGISELHFKSIMDTTSHLLQ
jgi:hypothetical protein